MKYNNKSGICRYCGNIVSNLGKHLRRGRCEAYKEIRQQRKIEKGK